jgi:hypothetical protein
MRSPEDPNKGRISRRREIYSHRVSDQLKEQRRVEGKKRNEAWEGLATEEKLEILAKRPGESRRQVFKLTGTDMSAQEALEKIRAEV